MRRLHLLLVSFFWVATLLSAPLVVAESASGSAGGANSVNVRVSPLSLIYTQLNGGVDFKIADQLTLGPEGSYSHSSISRYGSLTRDLSFDAYLIGARLNWFPSGVFRDGFYLAPSLSYLGLTLTSADSIGPMSGSAALYIAKAVIGYGWFWTNFNTMLGLGYLGSVGNSTVTVTDSAGTQSTTNAPFSGAIIELTLGWAF